MGTNTNQIATEYNTESSYGAYINSTTPTKCITVNRLLNGLLETNNNPSYLASDLNSGFTNKYHIKSWGSSPETVVNIRDGTIFGNSTITSQIIETNANNYGIYPFSTGTAFLAIQGNPPITGEVVFTYGKRQVNANALSTDDVSLASMDFDNPEEDTESTASTEYPTILSNPGSNTRGVCYDKSFCALQNDDCQTDQCYSDFETCSPTVDCEGVCPKKACALQGCSSYCPSNCPDDYCLTDCPSYKYEEITHPPFGFKSIYLYLQIYDGVDSLGNDSYRSILNISTVSGFTATVELNNSTTQTFSINIPTGTGFPISRSPNGVFKFRIYGNFSDNFNPDNFTDGLYASAEITVNMPKINFVVYNPGPKCIKYNDLSTVYSLYGK